MAPQPSRVVTWGSRHSQPFWDMLALGFKNRIRKCYVALLVLGVIVQLASRLIRIWWTPRTSSTLNIWFRVILAQASMSRMTEDLSVINTNVLLASSQRTASDAAIIGGPQHKPRTSIMRSSIVFLLSFLPMVCYGYSNMFPRTPYQYWEAFLLYIVHHRRIATKNHHLSSFCLFSERPSCLDVSARRPQNPQR